MKILLKNGIIPCIPFNPAGQYDIETDEGLITGIYPKGTHEAGKSADEIDCSGCFIIPGLINLHTHIQRRHLSRLGDGVTFRGGAAEAENLPAHMRLMWAYRNAVAEIREGVTTIRDCGSKERISIQLKQAVDAGIVPGPRIKACGYGIAAPGGHETHLYQGAVEVRGIDEIREAVKAEASAGAGHIKFMGSGGLGGMPDRENPWQTELNAAEMKAGVDAAHELGLRATVHAMGAESIRFAVQAGIDCIEHGVELETDTIEDMKEKDTAYVPTLSGITNVMKRIRLGGRPKLADEIEETVVSRLRKSISDAIRAGLRIGTGTDTLGNLVDEICLLHELGMEAADAVSAATSVAAGICGYEKTTGRIAEGLAADLLVLNGNPLDNLGNLRDIKYVVIRGSVIDPKNI